MRKKVDARVRTLIENGVQLRHRSLFIIVGDAAREQVRPAHTRTRLKRTPRTLETVPRPSVGPAFPSPPSPGGGVARVRSERERARVCVC